MFEHRPNLTAVRGFTLALCLALLAGCGGSGGSADSAPIQTPAGAPSAPANVTATPGNAQANLTWSASSGAASYAVKRSTTSGGPYANVATAMSPSYTDATVSNGTTYFYVVAAVNSAGASADSAQASVTPAATTPSATIPATPTGLSAAAGTAQASLTWSASAGATSYNVKRATTNGGPYSQVGTPTSTSYTDSAVTAGTTYYYVVSAVNSAGESANSTQVSAVPAAGTPPPATFGTWINVTPANVDLTNNLTCQNFGVETVQVDPLRPADLYAEVHCQGIWKSTDYGASWTGPINTGSKGTTVADCAGGITVAPNTAGTPTLYESCIRGAGLGFWKSVDGGVNWTNYFVAPTGASRQDFYPPVVDPYDANHLLMPAHEQNVVVESIDGGQNWTNVQLASGMLQTGGTGFIFFINTGNAATTRGTWLWLAQQSGGQFGTWRTANGGANPTWAQVDKNEHPHGASQIYQPDNNGVVYMAGVYSSTGGAAASAWGVLRSTDYGLTWSHVGAVTGETLVVGTPKNVYAMYGWSTNTAVDPVFEVAAQPGNGTWAQHSLASFTGGPHEVRVVNDGTHNVLVGAMGLSGLWRYIEP